MLIARLCEAPVLPSTTSSYVPAVPCTILYTTAIFGLILATLHASHRPVQDNTFVRSLRFHLQLGRFKNLVLAWEKIMGLNLTDTYCTTVSWEQKHFA